jgi:poly(glycerol-phosphate) alpha-glucosyltransferase
MHIVHLLDSSSRLAGGIAEAVKGLAKAQAAAGAKVSVLAGTDAESEADRAGWAPLTVDNVASDGFANGIMGAALRARLNDLKPDLVHLHGLWGPAARALAGWGGRVPFVVSPHGMLDSWALARSAAKKRVSAAVWEGGLLREAGFVHALAQAEEQAVRAYGVTGRVEIVSNGVACPAEIGPLPSRPPRTMLFMARIHPKKGLAELIAAWALLPPAVRQGWHLQIAGWDEIGILDALRQQADAAGLGDGISFPGGLHGADKDAALRGASAFILPSYSEGLPMAVLEAWAYGLPVFMTQACNLPEGFTAGAALQVTTDPAQMAQALACVLADDVALAAAGAAGRKLALEHFAWDTIAARMLAHYHSVLEGR